jgi:aryl-alcohol dehydrogenase-like predicted oxidoreductase
MSLDSYMTLGRSDLRVSPLCLGATSFGDDRNFGSSVSESKAILRRFVERGGNFVDAGDMHTKGHSEKIIGDFLGGDQSRRDRLVIGTRSSGSNAKTMVRTCEQSLRRLQTDYIDIYWLQDHDALTPIEETLRALDSLVAAGKVRYAGFCNTPAWRVCHAQMVSQMRGGASLVAVQVEYSLLERSVEHEIVPMAQAFGLTIMPWAPLKFGVLSGNYTRACDNAAQPSTFGIPIRNREHELIETLHAVAERHSTSVAAVALAWLSALPGDGPVIVSARTLECLDELLELLIDALLVVAERHRTSVASVALAWLSTRPGVGPVVISARTLEQLDENLQSLDIALSAQDVADLERITTPSATPLSRTRARQRPSARHNLAANGLAIVPAPQS